MNSVILIVSSEFSVTAAADASSFFIIYTLNSSELCNLKFKTFKILKTFIT